MQYNAGVCDFVAKVSTKSNIYFLNAVVFASFLFNFSLIFFALTFARFFLITEFK